MEVVITYVEVGPSTRYAREDRNRELERPGNGVGSGRENVPLFTASDAVVLLGSSVGLGRTKRLSTDRRV